MGGRAGGLAGEEVDIFSFRQSLNQKVFRSFYNYQIMIKICLVALLLSLTCQLTLETHLDGNPLLGNSYSIKSNSLHLYTSAIVSFDSQNITFNSSGNVNVAEYRVVQSKIFFSKSWTASKADIVKDSSVLIRWLFNNSENIQVGRQGVITLTDVNQNLVIVLSPQK